ncbi:glycosyltransferase [Paenibacillus daejeonensis]|uniref:glycosyltransferase n=1 Tax=Paenibacillus daejeonensis TaxID=135193 RepID=UPI0003756A43|nr:glycosyltransferase [Paenibacillus daejeonensis]
MPQARPHVTLSMVVRNEADRYLIEALTRHRAYIDAAVIIDDASTDHTPDLCVELLHPLPVKLVRNPVPLFQNEILLRKLQWQETIATSPDWILNLDADEWFEDRFALDLHTLMDQNHTDLYSFRLYDFWNRTAYREDQLWHAHVIYRPLLLRYQSEFNYRWKETAQHCGRYPDNIFGLPNGLSDLRVKHMGWSDPLHRISKFQRYMKLDPEGQFGSLAHYYSILDDQPRLMEWVEDEVRILP